MAHERVRHLVLNIKREALSDRYGSYRKFAQACDMNPSTITDMISGRAWPNTLTIAKIETEIGMMMWPSYQKANRRKKKDYEIIRPRKGAAEDESHWCDECGGFHAPIVNQDSRGIR